MGAACARGYPVIISHSRKFIFIKTIKTAGSSLELALSRYCAPGDVITRLWPDEEEVRRHIGGVAPQNYHARPPRSGSVWVFSDPKWNLGFRGALMRLAGRKQGRVLHQHWKAAQLRQMLPEEVWSNYFKFTIIRNPFHRIESQYYWENFGITKYDKSVHTYESFDQWLRYNGEAINLNWATYTEDDRILVDHIIKYEELDDGLREVERRLGLDGGLVETMATVRAKEGVRPKDRPAGETLEHRHRRLIEIMCEKEIALGGYAVPARAS
jgi:hypothetical protein